MQDRVYSGLLQSRDNTRDQPETTLCLKQHVFSVFVK